MCFQLHRQSLHPFFSYSQHAAGVLEDTDSRDNISHHQMPVPGADQLLGLLHDVHGAGRRACKNVLASISGTTKHVSIQRCNNDPLDSPVCRSC